MYLIELCAIDAEWFKSLSVSKVGAAECLKEFCWAGWLGVVDFARFVGGSGGSSKSLSSDSSADLSDDDSALQIEHVLKFAT